VIAGQEVSAV